MPEIERPDGARIHYQVHGEGFPVLLLAPGGVSSQIECWDENFYHPVRELSGRFRVIAMDQRHAGRSPAPTAPFSYEQTVGDQLAVLDGLGVERAHVVAAGSGCVHAWALARTAPERVVSVVAQQPEGRDAVNTLGTFFTEFDEAMRHVRAASFDDPETMGLRAVVEAAVREPRFSRNPAAGPFAQRLADDPEFREEFLKFTRESYVTRLVRFRDGFRPDGSAYFSVPEEWMARFPAPLLVLPGGDERHPEGLAKRLGAEVPRVRLVDAGFDAPERVAGTVAEITGFLAEHTPR
ncbi:alpha/beta fold hydrolase [Streptomyces sp. NPDC012888]|uniref:alpha/beta fold hydrolase n=1 Tax=Streptomyces sp. NPDC012888 TaxID=3364855 RepID=UPI0036BB4C2F